MNNEGFNVTIEDIERIVAEDDKQRYSFNKNKIRANQGHSINVNLQLNPEKPPKVLYHGTSIRAASSILKEGIKRQERQYVHLSSDADTAMKVGNRHSENTVIFVINSEQMYNDGFKFFLSNNEVWLINYVPPKYLSKINCDENYVII